jgi:ferredoxin-type protein NapH
MKKKGLATALFISLFFGVFASFFVFGRGIDNLRTVIIGGVVVIFHVFILFMIFYTGNIYKWRKIFFTSYAVAFVISFVWWVMGDRGHMWLLNSEVLYSQAPMCHIVVPMLILPAIFMKEIIFPISLSSAALMILLTIVVTVIFGRSFCAWGCFYGGQDELFSSIAKKKRWQIKTLHPFVKYFPFAMLSFIVLHSFITMSPTYCVWFCPFKATTEFFEINSFIRVIQTIIFISLWVILVVLLPVLSKKRIQCSFFCPMGAFLSCSNKINLFGISIDKNKCINCNRCVSSCPNFAITEESLSKGKVLMTCSKCGACLNVCTKNAITLGIKGVKHNYALSEISSAKSGFWKDFGRDLWDPAVVFIFGIFTIATVLSSHEFIDSISRLLKYFIGV